MKLLLLSLTFATSSALAGGVDNMVAQCENVMACGLCRIELDQKVYKPDDVKIAVLRDGLIRRIPVADYNWLRSPQDNKDASGQYIMCKRVSEAMQQPESPRGLAARSMFDDRWNGRSYCPTIGDKK